MHESNVTVRLRCACIVQAEEASEQASSADGTGSSVSNQTDQSGELQSVLYGLEVFPSPSFSILAKPDVQLRSHLERPCDEMDIIYGLVRPELVSGARSGTGSD